MGDSDDEYDRKRRDKFRGERSSGDNYRSDRRDDRSRGRDDWPDRYVSTMRLLHFFRTNQFLQFCFFCFLGEGRVPTIVNIGRAIDFHPIAVVDRQ